MISDPREPDALPEMVSLPRELTPGPHLEDRVVSSLHHHGLLQTRRSAPFWRVAAAALILFVAGLAAGRFSSTPPAAPDTARFVLLLQGGPGDAPEAEEARLVAEYRAWAAGLRDQGRYVSGERLGQAAAVVPDAGAPQAAPIRGYFVISAASFEDAVAVARSCPHASRGGSVVVRPIDPT